MSATTALMLNLFMKVMKLTTLLYLKKNLSLVFIIADCLSINMSIYEHIDSMYTTACTSLNTFKLILVVKCRLYCQWASAKVNLTMVYVH